MKWLFALVLLGALSFWAYKHFGVSPAGSTTGVRLGATVEEVEKALGPPSSVLPQMGGQLRTYKTAEGRTYVLVFMNGELKEIH